MKLSRLSSMNRFGYSLILILLVMIGCAPGQQKSPTPATTPTAPLPTPLPQAEVVFSVDIPTQSPPDQGISVDIVDDVTGIALNPSRFKMEPISTNHYEAHVPVPAGSVVKYRYIRGSKPPAIEYTSNGKEVRYRMFIVSGPTKIQDTVAAWNDVPYKGKTGRVTGKVIDTSTGEPIPGMLVECAGQYTFTAGDGSYLLENILPGTHTIIAYSLNGEYHPFQQGALIAEESSTPAMLQVSRSSYVKVTFLAHIPTLPSKNTIVRMVGNTYALGNTFADISSGFSTVASRAPALSLLPDGRYTLVLNLPAGLDLRYKYSLGDGFWNSEHKAKGGFIVRQVIVPPADTVIEDYVYPWESSTAAPVHFSVSVPENTPSGDVISIQFNPYGWTEPIPMWPDGKNHWTYTLFSPFEILGDIGYRYCRNDQCGIADDASTKGKNAKGFPFRSSPLPQAFEDDVTTWTWLGIPEGPTNVVSSTVNPRAVGFLAGVALAKGYHPSWQAFLPAAVDQVQQLKANVIVLTPTWTYSSVNPPVLGPIAGKDALWDDLLQTGSLAKKAGLGLIIYPNMARSLSNNDWWTAAQKDPAWWQSWFDRYSTFITNFAEFANLMDARAIVIGGPDVAPALPGGLLPDGSPSNVPDFDAQRWSELLADVRSRFHGTIYWASTYEQVQNLPDFVSSFDGIYLLWSQSLVSSPDASNRPLPDEFGRLLDEGIAPIQQKLNKPVILAIDYPSQDNSAAGCASPAVTCLPFDPSTSTHPESPDVHVNMQAQVDVYSAALTAVNSRAWVGGFISTDFFPPVVLQDTSGSIHGKPAWDVLWYWYPKLLGR